MKRLIIGGIVIGVLIGGASFFAGWQVGERGRPEAVQRLNAIEAGQEAAEETARSVVEALGPLCTGFDFLYKHDMAGGAFRPVRCSIKSQIRTALFVYGFDASQTQEAWVSEWGRWADQRGSTLVEDGTWAMEVLDKSIVGDVRSMMSGSL
jgi:hypothetical protein